MVEDYQLEIQVYHLPPREGEAVHHQHCLQCGGSLSTAKASTEEAEAEDSSITRPGNLLEMDEILPKYLKSLDVQGLSWLSPPLDWQTGMPVPLFKKGDWRLCYNPVLQHSSASSAQKNGGFRPDCRTLDQLSTSKSKANVHYQKKVVCHLWVGGESLPLGEEFKYFRGCVHE